MEPAVLLDGNVLVALADQSHVHHSTAERWFGTLHSCFATCPITQGSLLRVLLATRAVANAESARVPLRSLIEHPRHRFWADAIDYLQVDWKGVLGHRQVTDAYLASLARRHGGKLATFDQGLAALHPDVVELIPAT
ncbi:MAG: PIN domain-containing protein [Thermomonas sp.]|uniref:TA system VapC family ribonuclease toxin n=1 Tax=Thermomonas sp. TaxID=1971895 RepID=UPI0039E30441